jgi:IQ domain-containing protein H
LNFPSHFSTSRLLLYSPKSLKRLLRLVKNKISYIVPGYPSNDDIKLATYLQVPMMMGEPQKNLVMSMKSSAKRLFANHDIPAPPGAYEIYDEKEFVNSLTVLIANNLAIDNWIFKIDDEFSGRGIATFTVGDLKQIKSIRKSKPEISEALLASIKEIIIYVINPPAKKYKFYLFLFFIICHSIYQQRSE